MQADLLPAPVRVCQRQTLELRNANWFDGNKFERGTWFVDEAGRFTRNRPAHIERVLSLQHRFLVPAYGDAHCHNFSHLADLDKQTSLYIHDGVLSAKSMTDPRRTAVEAAGQLHRWGDPLNIAYAHGGLTGTRSHPAGIYESIALGYHGETKPEHAQQIDASRLEENDAYFVIDTRADLERKWPLILAGKPDFIKVYLLDTENYREHVQQGYGLGLNPELLPLVVQKAHAAGLRVSAHINTAHDFHVGVISGIDEFAHAPLVFAKGDMLERMYKIHSEDARQAAAQHISLTLTLFASDYQTGDPNLDELHRRLTKYNVELLRSSGVHLALGFDGYNTDSVGEVQVIRNLHLFSDTELLRLWSTDTVHAIFPGRKIGSIAEGDEATFLILAGNPLRDFSNTQRIEHRFITGQELLLRGR
ncbi:hypothetical protein RBB75_04290 [Tunturibacter empetritectus]|uniref:Amidohydrolase-related domain-containing protein n=1 Tax=Tunturiibacter empetritectus TaxID=3069691 RepID=A0AAU7ZEW7_9BACT